MPQSIAMAGAEPMLAERPLNIDTAVRAALSQHPTERRTFANEDDMEGHRSSPADALAAPPSP